MGGGNRDDVLRAGDDQRIAVREGDVGDILELERATHAIDICIIDDLRSIPGVARGDFESRAARHDGGGLFDIRISDGAIFHFCDAAHDGVAASVGFSR